MADGGHHFQAGQLRQRKTKEASETAGFFAIGRELESATVNHQFTAAEKKVRLQLAKRRSGRARNFTAAG